MAAGVSAAQEIITERKIDCWKKKLLDTGRRNRMIHYRETKRTALKILEPGPEELFNLLAFGGRTLTFQRPVSKDSDFRTCCMLALLETLSCPLSVYVGDIKAEGTVLDQGEACAGRTGHPDSVSVLWFSALERTQPGERTVAEVAAAADACAAGSEVAECALYHPQER